MVGQKGVPARYGGIERHVEHLSIRLGGAGHEVLVYTRAWFGSANDTYAPGVSSVITPTVRTKHLDAIVHTFTSTIHAMRTGVDVIHYHGVGPALLSWVPRVFSPRIKVVTTFHCIDARQMKWGSFASFSLRLGERFACLFPHQTIVVSKLLQSYCRSSYHRDTEYVPNGIEEPARAGQECDQETLEKFGLEPDGYVLMVARLLPDKGAHHLVRAYHELKRNSATRGKKLVIVGGSAFTTDYIDKLLHMVEGDPDIILTGYQNGHNLDCLFANAYLVAHPSETEGLPITVLEAMSYGKTVLASDIPENLEVTHAHGINFQNRSVHDLTEKLEFLINSPSFVTRVGAESKKFVLEHYHWDEIARSVDGVYQELFPQEGEQELETRLAN